MPSFHDDVIKWKQFPRYWPFVRGIWFHMNIMSAISGDLTNKNNNKKIERHTAHTIVPWPNPKQWMMVGILLVIMFYTRRSISHEHEYGFSTVRLRQNYCHFDSLSRLIFLYEKCFTLIKIANRHDDIIKWKHFLLSCRLVIFSSIWALKTVKQIIETLVLK